MPRFRCVIVDDNPHFTAAARNLLQRQGITVAGTATSGREAMVLAAELHPDVFLVDIDLGAESGFDLAEALTRDHAADVVLISAYSENEFAELIAASPAVGFVPKAELSVSAIRALMADRVNGRDSTSPDDVSEPPGT